MKLKFSDSQTVMKEYRGVVIDGFLREDSKPDDYCYVTGTEQRICHIDEITLEEEVMVGDEVDIWYNDKIYRNCSINNLYFPVVLSKKPQYDIEVLLGGKLVRIPWGDWSLV